MSNGSTTSTKIILPMDASGKTSHSNVSSLRKDIFEHISTVSHSLTFGVVGFIIFLCFEREFVLFTWHPLLYTIGWTCLMMEAILVVSPDSIFSKRLSFKLRVQYHWIIQILAVGCSAGGFFVDFIRKNKNNFLHFQSTHALLGLIAMALCIPTCINGIAALFNIQLKKYIKPSINKLFHAICGIITFAVGTAGMVSGLYKGWFTSRTGEASQIFCITIIVFGTVWCLLRPLITAFNRVKSIVS